MRVIRQRLITGFCPPWNINPGGFIDYKKRLSFVDNGKGLFLFKWGFNLRDFQCFVSIFWLSFLLICPIQSLFHSALQLFPSNSPLYHSNETRAMHKLFLDKNSLGISIPPHDHACKVISPGTLEIPDCMITSKVWRFSSWLISNTDWFPNRNQNLVCTQSIASTKSFQWWLPPQE